MRVRRVGGRVRVRVGGRRGEIVCGNGCAERVPEFFPCDDDDSVEKKVGVFVNSGSLAHPTHSDSCIYPP